MADIAKLPPAVRAAIKERGVSESRVALMSPKELFCEYCTWHGLINWGDALWENVMALSKLAPAPQDLAAQQPRADGEVPKVVIWIEGGNVQGALSATPIQVGIMDYDVEGDDETIDIPQSGGKFAEAVVGRFGWVLASKASQLLGLVA